MINVTFTSSAPSVATVDSSGTIVAVAPGNATIVATEDGGKTATCEVTVVRMCYVEGTTLHLEGNVGKGNNTRDKVLKNAGLQYGDIKKIVADKGTVFSGSMAGYFRNFKNIME